MIDVGANVGLMTCRTAFEVGETGKVHAFEPHPDAISYLKGNVRVNGFQNVVFHNVALGCESDRSIGLDTSKNDDMTRVMGEGGVRVPLARLDDYSEKISGEIALMKADVEGYEKFVFEGGREILSRTKCVLFEAYEEHAGKFDYGVPEMVELLAAQGFSIYRWKEDVVTKAASDDPIKSLENLLAVRDVDELLERTGFRRG